MLLDELKQSFSYDNRLSVISFSILTSAEIWQCGTIVPLYMLPQDEHFSQNILNQVRGQILLQNHDDP
jgi:hypothetical protein